MRGLCNKRAPEPWDAAQCERGKNHKGWHEGRAYEDSDGLHVESRVLWE